MYSPILQAIQMNAFATLTTHEEHPGQNREAFRWQNKNRVLVRFFRRYELPIVIKRGTEKNIITLLASYLYYTTRHKRIKMKQRPYYYPKLQRHFSRASPVSQSAGHDNVETALKGRRETLSDESHCLVQHSRQGLAMCFSNERRLGKRPILLLFSNSMR